MALPFVAASVFGYLVYRCWEESRDRSGEQLKLETPIVILSKQYAESDSEWSNVDNLTTSSRVKEVLREPGPYGVPRVVYEGAGESWIVNYGDNLTVI